VGDLIVELDEHPTITRAAEHLGRRPATALPDVDVVAAPSRPALTGRGVSTGLIFAALPRPDVPHGDLVGLSATMQTWRGGLRPGGYLLTALTAPGCDDSLTEHPVTYRAGVIAAARTAGLIWQQEFLVLTAQLPDNEPPPGLRSALVDGRHLRVHVKLLAFCNNAGGSDA
jgi:hypothetical protein